MLDRALLMLAVVVAVASQPVRARAAGDVRVTQTGSVLRITGDAQANRIGIAWDDPPPGYAGKSALSIGSVDGGTINGGTNLFYGVGLTRVIVNLGAGDDRLSLVDVDFAELESLRIDTGSGNDVVDGEDSGAAKLEIFTGAGDDGVFFDGGGCGSCTIRSGAGVDHLWLNAFGIGSARLDAGRGNDEVTVCTSVGRALDLRGGAGNDDVSTCGSFEGYARLDGGSGVDTLSTDFTTFERGPKILYFEQQ